MSDEAICFCVFVVSVLVVVLGGMFNNRYEYKTALELGYCQVAIAGISGSVWQKCPDKR